MIMRIDTKLLKRIIKDRATAAGHHDERRWPAPYHRDEHSIQTDTYMEIYELIEQLESAKETF